MRFASGIGLLLGAMAAAMPASATVVTNTYRFKATPLYSSDPASSGPNGTASGKFTITFDDTLETHSTTTGVTLNSLSFALGSPLAASYTPAIPFLGLLPNFQIGGALSTVNVTTTDTDDFFLEFSDALSDHPKFKMFGLTQQGSPYSWTSFTGSVTRVQSAVPEPMSWTIMIGGLALVGGAMRRRAKPVSIA